MALYTARGIQAISTSGGGAFPSFFQGNPNVTISAIDTSGGIAASRTSGQIPAFVQVSGSAITATGTSIPYEDLEYAWNFGDPSGTETFTSYYTTPGGTTVNANNAQTGPEAAYVYRTAGTYTITLSVRGKTGSNFTTNTKTMTFTASAFSASGGEWYFDSAATGGGNGSIGLPFNDLATMNTKFGIANTLIHLKKGSSWTASTGNVLVAGASGLRIDNYGSGAAPILDSTGVDVLNLSIQSSSQNLSDIVISGVNFTCNQNTPDGSPMVQIRPGGSSIFSDIYLDNCTVASSTGTQTGMIFMDVSGSDITQALRAGLWNVSVSSVTAHTPCACVFGMPGSWGFVMGGTFSGPGNDTTHDHHIYPNTALHSLYRYINFVAASGKNCNINTNTGVYTSLPTGVSQYVCMSDNNFTGTVSAWDASNANSTAVKADGYFQNFVSQLNAIQGFSGTPLFFQGVGTMTVRYNKCWNNVDFAFFSLKNGLVFTTAMRIYGNYIYKASGAGSPGSAAWAFDGNTDGNSAPWSIAQTITDNIIQDDRTTANAMTGGFSNWQSVSSFVDRNQYFCANDSDNNIWSNNASGSQDGGTFISLATMRGTFGFEVNSTYTATTNPSWPDPSNGNFG